LQSFIGHADISITLDRHEEAAPAAGAVLAGAP
jgi:hypothetical protein